MMLWTCLNDENALAGHQTGKSNVGVLAGSKCLGDKYSGLVLDQIAFGSHFIEIENLMPIRKVHGGIKKVHGTIFLYKFGIYR